MAIGGTEKCRRLHRRRRRLPRGPRQVAAKASTMNNLKLGMKMLLLTAILLVTAAGVAWVGVSRLGTLDATVQDMVNRTLRKVALTSQVRAELLLAVRQQKNTSDIARRQAFDRICQCQQSGGGKSRADDAGPAKARPAWTRTMKKSEAMTDLNEKVRLFISSNQQCLDLGVLNTNVKATRLCWGDFKNVVGQILALTDKVMNDADSSVPPGDLRQVERRGRCSPPQARLRYGQDGPRAAQDSQTAHRDEFIQPGFCADRSAGDRAEGPAQPVSQRAVAPAAAQRCRGVGGRPFRDE